VLDALVGGEGREQHHAGVVDQDVQLALHALRRGDEGVAIGDVGLDGDGTFAEFLGQRLDAVDASRQQRESVAVGGQGAGRSLADVRRGAGDDRDAAGVLIGAQVSPVSKASVYARGASSSVVARPRALVMESTMLAA
jgi:hypothetical protein